MNLKRNILLLLLCLFLASCVDEYYFGKSSGNSILEFGVQGQTGNAVISEDERRIDLRVGQGVDLKAIKTTTIKLSTFASSSPGAGQEVDYSGGTAVFTVTAEDGSRAAYTVYLEQEGAHPQLENSDFNLWHTTPAGYPQPGADQNSIWATGNAGVVTLKEANTTPLEINENEFAAHMETLDMGSLAGLAGQRVGAGSIFTGVFELDLNNPANSAQFGISFSARPAGFSVDYAYIPGQPYMDGRGNILEKEDACDIYLLLENRTGTDTRRIATAWFRSGEVVSEAFERIEMELVYGELSPDTPDYLKPANGMYGDPGDEVSHLIFVATSSYAGANLEGGIGSILVIDNLQLNY